MTSPIPVAIVGPTTPMRETIARDPRTEMRSDGVEPRIGVIATPAAERLNALRQLVGCGCTTVVVPSPLAPTAPEAIAFDRFANASDVGVFLAAPRAWPARPLAERTPGIVATRFVVHRIDTTPAERDRRGLVAELLPASLAELAMLQPPAPGSMGTVRASVDLGPDGAEERAAVTIRFDGGITWELTFARPSPRSRPERDLLAIEATHQVRDMWIPSRPLDDPWAPLWDAVVGHNTRGGGYRSLRRELWAVAVVAAAYRSLNRDGGVPVTME